MAEMIYMHTARLSQALASPKRLRALNLLAQSPRTVGRLGEELGQSLASTSAQLKVLRGAGLVVDERRGREVLCRLASDEAATVLVAVRKAAQALLPDLREVVREAEEDSSVLEGMSLRQLRREVQAGRVTLVDLRPEAEYAFGHLPKAKSTPLASLSKQRLGELAAEFGDRSVVAYCRGPWCVMAREGTKYLIDAGVEAKRLLAGVAEWRAEGLRLASA